jgi:hypothetical protein
MSYKRIRELIELATAVPVVGGVIRAVELVCLQYIRMLRHPFKMVHNIKFDDPSENKVAFEILSSGIVVSYLIRIPALLKHSYEVSQSFDLIYEMMSVLLSTVILHSMLLIIGSKKTFRVTFISTCYISGISIPLFTLLFLPIQMEIDHSLLTKS